MSIKLPSPRRAGTRRRDAAAADLYRNLAGRYKLPGAPKLILAPLPSTTFEIVRVPQRDQVLSALDAHGIGWGLHYPIPSHQQTPFKQFARTPQPVTETAAGEIVSVPMYPTITPHEVERVRSAARRNARECEWNSKLRTLRRIAPGHLLFPCRRKRSRARFHGAVAHLALSSTCDITYALIIVLGCAALVYAVSALGAKSYAARTEIYYPLSAQNAGSSLRVDCGLSTQMVAMEGHAVLDPVAAKYHMSYDALKKEIVTLLQDSEVIRIEVDDKSAVKARVIAGAIVASYLKTQPNTDAQTEAFLNTQIAGVNRQLASLSAQFNSLEEQRQKSVANHREPQPRGDAGRALGSGTDGQLQQQPREPAEPARRGDRRQSVDAARLTAHEALRVG